MVADSVELWTASLDHYIGDSCAVGIAMKSEEMDFDALCTKADEAMYVDKQQMKAKQKEK